MAASPLESLVASGTKLWLDSIDPQEVAANRALDLPQSASDAIAAVDAPLTDYVNSAIACRARWSSRRPWPEPSATTRSAT